MQAVILAAGRGLRLRPLTETTPKALVDVCGTPLIMRILASLPSNVTEIFIVVGHLKEQVMDTVGATFGGKPVRYVVQDPLDGTGSALHLLRDQLHGQFLAVNGDDLYEASDLERLVTHDLAILTIPTDNAGIASARQDANGRLTGLDKASAGDGPTLRVCGAYALDERFFRYPLAEVAVHGKTEYSLPHTLASMARACDIRVERARSWYPVGTPEELDRARATCG